MCCSATEIVDCAPFPPRRKEAEQPKADSASMVIEFLISNAFLI